MKNLLVGILVLMLVVGGLYYVWSLFPPEPAPIAPEAGIDQTPEASEEEGVQEGYKNATYIIEGEAVTLIEGVSEVMAASGSATMIETEYFGNELKTDLDNDGDEDIVFLVTQNPGGSGTFFYAVAALNTPEGYVGSDGYRLGDRIAPQSTDLSQNPVHRNVVVINYADRAEGATMVEEPTVNKSVYLKIDPTTKLWGVVEPNFEGEAQ